MIYQSFNPHTHAGCDILIDMGAIEKKVSIHTPTQGVTDAIIAYGDKLKVSIHTPTQGVTRYIPFPGNHPGFNPHTHAGCDIPGRICADSDKSFNPHTHAGCDVKRGQDDLIIEVSIHTPTQGVTVILWLIRDGSLFQSTHPRRV